MQATLVSGALTLSNTVVTNTAKSWRVAAAESYAKVELQQDAATDVDTFIPQVRVAGSNPADANKIGGDVTAKSVSWLGAEKGPGHGWAGARAAWILRMAAWLSICEGSWPSCHSLDLSI